MMHLLPIVWKTASLVPLLEIRVDTTKNGVGLITHHKTCMCQTGRFARKDIDERQFILVVLLARNKMNDKPANRTVVEE